MLATIFILRHYNLVHWLGPYRYNVILRCLGGLDKTNGIK